MGDQSDVCGRPTSNIRCSCDGSQLACDWTCRFRVFEHLKSNTSFNNWRRSFLVRGVHICSLHEVIGYSLQELTIEREYKVSGNNLYTLDCHIPNEDSSLRDSIQHPID